MSEYSSNQEGAIKIDQVIHNQWARDEIITLSKKLSAESIARTGKGLCFGIKREGEMNISRKNYSGIHLLDAEFVQTVTNETDFTGANLKNARFLSAGCHKTIFDSAILDGANMHAQPLLTCSLAGTSMQDIKWTGGLSHGCKFEGVILDGAKLSGTKFYETLFERVNAKNSDFTGSDFELSLISNCNFFGSVLDHVKLLKCSVIGTSFEKANLRKSILSEGSWINVDFSDASLYGAVLTSLIEGGLMMQSPNLQGANLTTAKLKVNIQGGNLRGVVADYAQFFGSNVINSDCTGANFSKATAIKSKFFGSGLRPERFESVDRCKF